MCRVQSLNFQYSELTIRTPKFNYSLRELTKGWKSIDVYFRGDRVTRMYEKIRTRTQSRPEPESISAG